MRRNYPFLKELQRSLDPFQLAKVIDRKLERIYRLANRRLSPKTQEKIEINQAKQVRSSRRKGYGKDARFASLEIPPGSHFPTATTATNILRLHIKWRDMDSQGYILKWLDA